MSAVNSQVFDPVTEAERLHKAVTGLGTDEKELVRILTSRSAAQIQRIAAIYEERYKASLLTDLKSDTSGHFYHVIKALVLPPAAFDAHERHRAIKGLGTNEDTLIEIFGTRSAEELRLANQAYHKEYRASLAEDIVADTSGGFKDLLLALLTVERDCQEPLDETHVKADAQVLYTAGPGKWGTDTAVFIDIFARRGFIHLRAVISEFETICKKDVGKVLKEELSGDTLRAFEALVSIIQNCPRYFAARLESAIKGRSVKDRSLIRILVSRREKDLSLIATEYEKEYGKSLESIIKEKTSGDYRDALLGILQEFSKN